MNRNKTHRIIAVFLFVVLFAINGLGSIDSYAAVKAPKRVTKVTVDEGRTQVNEWIPSNEAFSDIPWNKRTILSISRTVGLEWKKVKGASGYKIYMSTKSAKKGYKLVSTIDSNYGYKGKIESGEIEYKGSKKAQVWFKVRAYKRNGKKLKYGKYSKPLKVVLLQRPIIASVSGNDNKVTVKWKKVYGAKKYEVLYATANDISTYIEKYNKAHPKSKLPAKHYKAFLATAGKKETKGRSCNITLPKEGNYFIHVRAVNGEYKSEIEYDYEYYDWWQEE